MNAWAVRDRLREVRNLIALSHASELTLTPMPRFPPRRRRRKGRQPRGKR